MSAAQNQTLDERHFLRLLEIVAPRKSDRVAALEAYFDDSGTHAGSPVLTVAGYIFRSDQAASLHRKWVKMLGKYELPYFHMVDCAHGAEPFDQLTLGQRIAAQTKAISLIGSHADFGVAVSVDEEQYAKWFKEPFLVPNPYSFCCWACINAMRFWMQAQEESGPISFFFESGHKHRADADKAVSRLIGSPEYASHTFVPKWFSGALQAADVLAYLHGKHIKDQISGKPRTRADYRALITGTDTLAYLSTGETIFSTERYLTSKSGRLLRLSGKATAEFAGKWVFID